LNGESVFIPEQPEYEFWCWVLAQDKYHDLVEDSELQAIREEWLIERNRAGLPGQLKPES